MASVINGTNVVLYQYDSNAKYYFNGDVSEGIIGGVPYRQLSRTMIIGDPANFTLAGDGTICSFITDANDPFITQLDPYIWNIECYASITTDVLDSPQISLELYKYDGVTFSLIATSAPITLTNTIKTKYTTTLTVPSTGMSSTDRLSFRIKSVNVDARSVTIYTQSTNITSVVTGIALGTPFGASTACSFEASTNQVEVTSQTSAWFKEYKNDVTGWTMSCDGFICLAGYSYLALLQKQLDRESVVVKFSIDNDNASGLGVYGKTIFNGIANITSISLTGQVENAATYSVSLQGTGAYTISGTQVINGGKEIVTSSAQVQMFTYTATGGETSITFSGGIGLSPLSITRGGIEVRVINAVGVPVGENVTFVSSTGVLTFARALEVDEFVRVILK